MSAATKTVISRPSKDTIEITYHRFRTKAEQSQKLNKWYHPNPPLPYVETLAKFGYKLIEHKNERGQIVREELVQIRETGIHVIRSGFSKKLNRYMIVYKDNRPN